MGFTDSFTVQALGEAESSGGKYIQESGVFFGTISEVEFKRFDSGAGSIKVSLRLDDNREANFVETFVFKKDKTDAYGMNFYRAICQFTGTVPQDPTQNGNKWTFPALAGKRIGLGIQCEWRDEFNDSGYQKNNLSIVAVYDYQSRRCASEIATNAPAAKYMAEIADKGVKLGKRQQQSSGFGSAAATGFGAPQYSQQAGFPTDDLPF